MKQIQTEKEDAAEIPGIRFVDYKDESQLEHVMSLVVRFIIIFFYCFLNFYFRLQLHG